jgi:prophage DNA circulation protein
MKIKDTIEATGIMQRTMARLVAAVPAEGVMGSNLRTACGTLSANALMLIRDDVAGPPLAACFDLARQTGATQAQLATVRNATGDEITTSSGATTIKWSIIGMCLATEGIVISAMTFVSREDVDALKFQMNAIFDRVEEQVADAMDQMTYQAAVALHAAIIWYLVETARPLPRILQFAFGAPMPTLVLANRLYADAGRADELLAENKIVHPAFAPATGVALSA